jgi:hypothetical protein
MIAVLFCFMIALCSDLMLLLYLLPTKTLDAKNFVEMKPEQVLSPLE